MPDVYLYSIDIKPCIQSREFTPADTELPQDYWLHTLPILNTF
jgi:hypothetical protein